MRCAGHAHKATATRSSIFRTGLHVWSRALSFVEGRRRADARDRRGAWAGAIIGTVSRRSMCRGVQWGEYGPSYDQLMLSHE